jgi:hypothetical protein
MSSFDLFDVIDLFDFFLKPIHRASRYFSWRFDSRCWISILPVIEDCFTAKNITKESIKIDYNNWIKSTYDCWFERDVIHLLSGG